MKPNKAIKDALKVTVSGAGTVLLSTVTSCALAVAIERAANRTLFQIFPHWYDNVEYANGLPHLRFHRSTAEEDANKNKGEGNKEEIEPIHSTLSGTLIQDWSNQRENSPIITTKNTDPPPLHRQIEKPDRTNEKNWNSVTQTTMMWSSTQSSRKYTGMMDEKRVLENISPERVSRMVLSCAMTAG